MNCAVEASFTADPTWQGRAGQVRPGRAGQGRSNLAGHGRAAPTWQGTSRQISSDLVGHECAMECTVVLTLHFRGILEVVCMYVMPWATLKGVLLNALG